MRFTKSIVAAGAGLVLGAVLLTAGPAAAVPAAPSVVHYDLELPGHPTWHVDLRPPPDTTLLRVYQAVKTIHEPESVHVLIRLYRWKYDIRVRGKWKFVSYGESAHADKADLAGAGAEVTWKLGGPPLFPDWTCKTGRYFLAESWTGRSSAGKKEHTLYFYPYRQGSRIKGDPHSYYGGVAPTRDESIRIKSCRRST